MAITISKEKECVTLINTFFTSGSSDQDEVVKVLIDVTEEVMRHQPGFISTSIHRSYDGSAVTNYAQWRSSEDWNAALQKAREHLQLLTKYTRKPALYEVIYIMHAADPTVSDSI